KTDEPRTFAHRGRDADQPRIACGHVADPVAEDLRLRRLPRRLAYDARGRVDARHAVIQDRVGLRRRIAVAFPRDDVQELRSLELAQIGERGNERAEIVAVDRADVIEAQLLEYRAREHHPFQMRFPALRELPQRWHARQHFLAAPADG